MTDITKLSQALILDATLQDQLDELRELAFERAVIAAYGNQSEAARQLKVNRRTIQTALERLASRRRLRVQAKKRAAERLTRWF